MGKSNIGKTHRELPAGERRKETDLEYIPELCTERFGSGRDSSGQALVIACRNPVGCDGVAYVIMPG